MTTDVPSPSADPERKARSMKSLPSFSMLKSDTGLSWVPKLPDIVGSWGIYLPASELDMPVLGWI
jgi:hypothetical protein